MKKATWHYVYKIIDSNNNVLYVGECSNPIIRLSRHKNSQGHFTGRKDIELVIIRKFNVKTADFKKKAFQFQCKIQKKYGLETDQEKLAKNAIAGAKKRIKLLKSNKIGNSRPVLCYDYKTKEYICEFKSTRQAQKKLGVTNLNNVLSGKQRRAGAYYFQYK
jgi:predicted GIY-YIG superfamily endonuclease